MEEDRPDFTTLLRTFMTRTLRTNKDLAQLTGLSINTLEKWTGGLVQRTRFASDVLKVARALMLAASDTTALLTAAGHPPLDQLQAQAQQTGDPALRDLLAPWAQASTPAVSPDTTADAPPRIALCYQLRPPVADFVGREREANHLIMALRSAATGHSAVISGVQGMGGIGKTELAYHVAHQVQDTFPDAQIVLNLRGSSAAPLTAEQALQFVIHALTPDAPLPDDLLSLEQQYRTVLHGQRALILADDAHDAAQVRSLIPPTWSALLITSCTRFTLPGMTAIDLEQLAAADAVTLLRSICARLRRAEALTIARACEYLPLALRVSAGILHTTPAISIAAYLERLTDERQRLAHLRDPDDPQLDVAATLALSYARLDAAAQQVFRQLGVLVADFATSMALAVVEAPPGVDVEALLYLLLRRNLVMYDAFSTRWRLHDLVRDLTRHALEDAQELAAAAWRYAQAAVQIAQATQAQYRAGGDAVLAALARFDAERAHIDEARRWAAAHAGTPEGDALLLADALATQHIGVLRYDRQHERIPQLERARIAAQRLGKRRGEGQMLNSIGRAYMDLGEARCAIPLIQQGLTSAQASGDRCGGGYALTSLGLAYIIAGEARRALPPTEQGLAYAQASGDQRLESYALNTLGFALVFLGEARRALPPIEQGLAYARASGDQRLESYALNTLGFAYIIVGEARRAIPFIEQGLTCAQAIKNRPLESEARMNLGLAYLALGQPRQTITCCEGALEITRTLRNQRQEGYVLSSLGRAHATLGMLTGAATTFEQALTIFQEIGDRHGEAECNWEFGLALIRQGERGRARSLLLAGVAYEGEIGHANTAEHMALLARLGAGEALPAPPALTPTADSDR